ncbi:venom factor-like [Gastrophryne carolinensis]
MGYGALCLVLLGLLAGSSYVQSCTLITSNLLRADSEETFVVDGHGSPIETDIIIQDFPKKRFVIAQGRISVNSGNAYLGTTKIKIPSTNLDKDPAKKQFVYVNVVACRLEKVVMVSYQSGFIFIQTDKPLYTPGTKVNYRVYTMTPDLKPLTSPLVIEILNPDNIIVQKDFIKQTSVKGMISNNFPLTELASFGIWSIVAKFEDTQIHNESAHFEVKEYVLPSIEVKITTEQNFFYIHGTDDFDISIHANFLYGKPVEGVAYVLFSVKKGKEKQNLPETLTRVQVQDGECKASLKRKVLETYFQKAEDMLDWKLGVSVTVITDSGSDMVEHELEDIHMVTSPYKILFTKTPKYFKPGMTFNIMVFVTNPDGSPARRVPVVATPGPARGTTQEDGTVRLAINTPANINSLPVKVVTEDPSIRPEKQASETLTAIAYTPLRGNYLHISIPGGELKMGDSVTVSFHIKNPDKVTENKVTEFIYVIINKGRMLKMGKQPRSVGQSPVTMQLEIKPEFLPSFHFVAYYVVDKSEIVSDSIWVDVEDTCMGTLELSGDRDRDNAVQPPGASIRLKLRADHKASVGLVAVDKGVFVLNNKFRFTQTKVWDTVEKYNTGCTAGSGANAAEVFHDAGLAVANNFHGSTRQREESVCLEKKARRRRDTAQLIQVKKSKESNYEGLELRCCRDGMRELPMNIKCERRAKRIQDGKKCADAFLDCCKHIEKLKQADRESNPLARSFEDEDYISDELIVSRTEFPESWLWTLHTMNEPPDARGVSTKIIPVFLKDSITTWEVLAVSMSENKGICVAKPHNIQVMMNFFIDLKLPYCVIRNEQVEIRAILYNYGNKEAKVRVEWSYNENYCSLSTAKSKYRTYATVREGSSTVVTFVIIPLNLGEHDIEIKVAGQTVSDGVKKKLKVVPEGRRTVKVLTSAVLDPETKGKSGVQEEYVPAVDTKNIVPNTPIETIVTVQGTAISELVEKSVDGADLNHLIVMPWGCGEQNMMSMTPSVIATHYLDITKQWERIGVQRREQAIQFINSGLTRQLTFRKPDGSYGAWIETPSSTWLTGYVVKVFAMATDLINIEKNTLCDSVKWLLLNKQQPDGLFVETAPVYHQDMAGGATTGAVELDCTLTAFVLIAMLESEDFCTGHVNNLRGSIDRAVSYVSEKYPTVNKPYTIAIASYALAKAGKLPNTNKLMTASTGNNHWVEPGSHELTLEATSYALLALVEKEMYTEAGPLVQWLTKQRFFGQVWGATQSTIMVFQALAKYQEVVPAFKDLDLDVSFRLPGRSSGTTFRINIQNAFTARSDQTPKSGDFVVTASGKGQGSLSAFTVYYAIETEKERKCTNFDLSLTVEEEPFAKGPEGTLASYSLNICARYLKLQDAGMSIMEVSMLTGFSVDIEDLNRLKQGVDRYISSFEFNKGAFDKSTLILYLDRVSHEEDDCLKFKIHQYFKVGLIQPASVTVYDYYSPESRCTQFYHMDAKSKLLGKICQGEVCRCAEESCFLQQQLKNVDANTRFEKACLPGVDYVYKTVLDEIQDGEGYVTYMMTIKELIKIGTDDNVLNQKRKFISHAKCRKALDLKVGLQYLVWGVAKDLWPIDNQHAYIITRDTWIEMWPNNIECQQPEHEQLCEELDLFKDELQSRGCVS